MEINCTRTKMLAVALALSLSTGLAQAAESPAKQADNLYDQAKSTYESGNLPQAIKLMQDAITLEKTLARPTALVRTESALATIFVANHQMDDARKTYDEALLVARQHHLIDDVLSITVSLGSLSIQQSRLADAKKYYEEALAEAKANDRQAIVANILINLSVVERSQNHLKDAMAYLQQAVPVSELNGSDAELGRLHMEIGRVHADLGSVNEALESYKKAKEKFNQDFDPASEGKALMASGQLLASKERYDEALAQLQEALSVLTQEDVQSKLLRIDCQTSLAAVLTAQGKLDESRKILTEALATAKALKSADRTREVLSELGYLLLVSGNVEQALDKYLAAFSLLNETGGKNNTIKAVLLTDLAMCYKALGQLDLAIKNYEQAYAFIGSSDARAKALAANNLAVAYLDSGKLTDFNKVFAEASALLASINDKKGQAILSYNLGQSKLFSGKPAEAVADYQAALSFVHGIGDKNFEGQVLRGEGLAYLLSGQPDKSIESYKKALVLADAGATEARWDCQLGLGKAYKALGQTDAALAALREAVDMAEQERGQLSRDTFKTFNLDLRQDCFYELVDLLVQQGKAEEALEVAERSRARAFVDLLAARQGVAHTLSSQGSEASLNSQALPTDFSHLSKEYAAASTVTAKALSLAELKQQIVDHQAVCLEFYSLPDKLLVWIIDVNGSVRLLPPQNVSQKQLRNNVVELYNLLIAQPKSLEEIKKSGQLRQAKLKQMHKLLLGPAESLLANGKQLVIIPHGPLFLVPFAALMNQQGKFVVENSIVSVVPAISVLQATAKWQQDSLRDNTLMAFGNPLTEMFATLGSLPYAEKEVVKASELFGAQKSTTRLGANATRATFVEIAPKSSIVHMACHGIINEEQPAMSGLVLAKDGADSGFMTVKDILNMPPLKSRLVVLSACQTGRGKITGDGVIGLSRAFIAAGTPSVIVSHWNVDDVIAEFQMEVFYKTLLAGKGKAEALRDAQLKTISSMEGSIADTSSPTFIRANPRYWAAFQLIGEAM